MNTITNQNLTFHTNTNRVQSYNPILLLSHWADKQEFYKYGYLVAMLLIQGNIIVPFSFWSMDAAGGGDFQMLTILILTFAVLTSNLAAMPLKVTIPVFAVSTGTLVILSLINLGTILL